MQRPRKIIHVDMDAFYAAVEQRDFPEYRGQPVVVGGSPQSRGVVATCSYEARPFGIHSAMPAAQAYRLCPQAVFVKPRFEVYRQVSQQIQQTFQRYSNIVEPLSLDEAYLDVSDNPHFNNSATLLAEALRRDIYETTRLTASAGVSYNKFLAKLASDINKPNGQFLITPEHGPAFIEQLPIGKFHGIGKATEAKMMQHGIETGADLKLWDLAPLTETFGKVGHHYYQIARGIDERPVQNERIRKSISSETTFEKDLGDLDTMLAHLHKLATEVAEYLARRELWCHTLTIKVKYADFKLITRSQSSPRPFQDLTTMQALLPELLKRTEAGPQRKVRLLGVGASNFADAAERDNAMRQFELF